MRSISLVLVLVAGCSLFGSVGLCEEDQFPCTRTGQIAGKLLDEISGIAASRKNDGVFWAHNDSGDVARIYAFDAKGRDLGFFDLKGVTARDCEDIAVGPGPVDGVDYIYLGDIGDNFGRWDEIRLYRIVEPTVDAKQPETARVLDDVEIIRLRYPDGPRDAECVMIDPVDRDIYIVTKREKFSRVYRAAYPHLTEGVQVLEFKCQLPWRLATGGDISRDGSVVIVRNYLTASIWKRDKGAKLWEAFAGDGEHLSLKVEQQGEAICIDANGGGCYTTSEGRFPPIYRYNFGPTD